MGFHLKSAPVEESTESNKEELWTNLALLLMAVAFPLSPLFWVVLGVVGLLTGNLNFQ